MANLGSLMELIVNMEITIVLSMKMFSGYLNGDWNLCLYVDGSILSIGISLA